MKLRSRSVGAKLDAGTDSQYRASVGSHLPLRFDGGSVMYSPRNVGGNQCPKAYRVSLTPHMF